MKDLVEKKPDELEHRYLEYEYILQNQVKVFRLWQQNVLLDDFKYSRRAGLALIFLPATFNILINKFKPHFYGQYVFSCACFLGMFYNFTKQYYKDIDAIVYKDTQLANQIRMHLQNIAYFNSNKSDYLYQTIDIIHQRAEKKKLQNQQ